jgi:hypothetical protein
MRHSPTAFVVVVAACSTASDTSVEQVELPTEASAAIDNTRQAMNSYDFESMKPYLTEDFTFQSYGDVNDLDSYIAYLDGYYESENFNLEVIGESSTIEGAETYIVAEFASFTRSKSPFESTTLSHCTDNGRSTLNPQGSADEEPEAMSRKPSAGSEKKHLRP